MEITFSTQHGTWIKNQFLAAQGIQYHYPTSEQQFSEAEKVAKTMPHWPYKGCVQKHNDIIIVNF